jgi:hypothetical protein
MEIRLQPGNLPHLMLKEVFMRHGGLGQRGCGKVRTERPDSLLARTERNVNYRYVFQAERGRFVTTTGQHESRPWVRTSQLRLRKHFAPETISEAKWKASTKRYQSEGFWKS